MIFLAGSCERCPNTTLVSSEHFLGSDSAVCSACGAELHIMAGRMFLEGDVALFDELSVSIAGSSILGAEAEQLALALEEAARRHGEQEALSVLVSWLPRLSPLRPLLSASPSRARQACAMVHLILSGRARARQSAFVIRPHTSRGETG